MTALALGTGALLLLILRPLNRQALDTGEKLHQARKEMFAVITDHLGGMKVAKSFGLEQHYARHFRLATGRLVDQVLEFTRTDAATRMFYEIGAAVALSLLFLCAVQLIHPAAHLLLLAFLFARLLPKLSAAQQCYQRLCNMLPSYGGVLALQARLVVALSFRPLTLDLSNLLPEGPDSWLAGLICSGGEPTGGGGGRGGIACVCAGVAGGACGGGGAGSWNCSFSPGMGVTGSRGGVTARPWAGGAASGKAPGSRASPWDCRLRTG